MNDNTGEIDAKALTITATGNVKTYDSTTSAQGTPVVSGLKAGDSVTGLMETYTDANAGPAKTVNVGGFTVNDGNGGNNYTVTTVASKNGTISRAGLTISATTNTKSYDSTTSAAAIPTVFGLMGLDSVTGLAEAYLSPGRRREQDVARPGLYRQ